MKILFFSLLIVFSCIGCINNKKGGVEHDFKTIKVAFDDSKEILSTDIIDSIQYIKLADTDDPIGNIRKMIVEDNKIILWDNSRNCIWIFSDKGRFIGQISKLGKGPGEYTSIHGFSYTAPNKIHINDWLVRAIKTYSISGEFIGEEITEGYTSQFEQYKNKKFYFKYDFGQDVNNKYLFNITDSANKNTGYFKYDKPFTFFGVGGDFILKSKDSLYFRLPYRDTIYALNNKQLISKYVFDFGKNRYPSKAIYNAKNQKEVDAILSKQMYEGNMSDVLISNKYIVLNYQRQKTVHEAELSTLIHNIQTDVSCTYYYLLKGDHEILLQYPMATDGEFFYFSRNSFELPKEVISRLKQQQHSAYDQNSNPTIIKYKYKL